VSLVADPICGLVWEWGSVVAVLTASASCRAFGAVLAGSGEVVSERQLVERVGSLVTLVQQLAAKVVAAHWTAADLDALASGRSADGWVLPVKGWMAVRRLGWGTVAPGGVYVSDRVRRVADEAAARALRLGVYRRSVLAAVVAAWPTEPGRRSEPEWAALRAVLPAGVSAAEVRNRTRQVQARLARHGHLPVDVTEVEGPPVVAAVALLAAADRQLVTLERTSDITAVLRVQLPLTAAPASRRDWAVHSIPINLPPTVPAAATLCTPSLRVVGHRVLVDLPFTTDIPATSATGHVVALGVDWGVNTLLTATVARLTGGRVATDGRMLRYDATAVSAKVHRLRRQREALAAKREHYIRLAAGPSGPAVRRIELDHLQARVEVEHGRVCARIRHLNDTLAWSAARWLVDQTIACGASVIYLEDLATLEARGRRRGNVRLSGQVRGRVAADIRHLAAKAGIAVVTVPARGTSKHCPRCGSGGSVLHHAPAPDRPTEKGWKWATCVRCGLSCDRDWAAAERIAARGLLGQEHTRTDRSTGVRAIHTIVEGNVPGCAPRSSRPARRNAPATPAATRSPVPTGPPHGGRPRNAAPNPPPARARQRLSPVCRSGVRFPPPPRWDSVRRDKHPRPTAATRCGQGLYAILTNGPVSTTSAPPPSSGSPVDHGTDADRLHPSGMSDYLRQPQRIADAQLVAHRAAPMQPAHLGSEHRCDECVRGMVRGLHLRAQALHSEAGRARKQGCDQGSRQPAALPAVGDDDRELGFAELAEPATELGPAGQTTVAQGHLRVPQQTWASGYALRILRREAPAASIMETVGEALRRELRQHSGHDGLLVASLPRADVDLRIGHVSRQTGRRWWTTHR
jgi:hypothetical protein